MALLGQNVEFLQFANKWGYRTLCWLKLSFHLQFLQYYNCSHTVRCRTTILVVMDQFILDPQNIEHIQKTCCIAYRKIFNIGGLKQLRVKRANRTFARGFHGVQGAGPLAGVARGQRPLALRKLCIWWAKPRINVTVLVLIWFKVVARMHHFYKRMCIFWYHKCPFQPLFHQNLNVGVARGQKLLYLVS